MENVSLKIPIRRTESGYKALSLVISRKDFETAVSADLDWLKTALISDTKDHINAELIWDNKLQTFKLKLLLKELIDGHARCEKKSN